MPRPRSSTLVLAALLSSAFVGVPHADAAPASDPTATTVAGLCQGGPGRMSITVSPTTDGAFEVEVTARRLADGSRWRGVVEAEYDERNGGESQPFRRRAVDGTWTVTTELPGPRNSDAQALFFVGAKERGERHQCFVLLSPDSPTGGYTTCRGADRFSVITANERKDGSTVVRSLVAGVRAQARWHLRLVATGDTGQLVTEFDAYAGDRGLVRSKVVLEGVDDARFRLTATGQAGGRCDTRLNPAELLVGRPAPDGPRPSLTDLAEAGNARMH